jgi:hypothetical protein
VVYNLVIFKPRPFHRRPNNEWRLDAKQYKFRSTLLQIIEENNSRKMTIETPCTAHYAIDVRGGRHNTLNDMSSTLNSHRQRLVRKCSPINEIVCSTKKYCLCSKWTKKIDRNVSIFSLLQHFYATVQIACDKRFFTSLERYWTFDASIWEILCWMFLVV